MKQLITYLTICINIMVYAQTDSTCTYRVNEVDEFTNTTKIVTHSKMFIEHTDSSLLKYYKRKSHSYFELETYCAKINDLRVIYFYIRIDSKNAYKYFGSISTDAKCIFKLKSGKTVTLNFSKYDTGDTNYERNYTSYSPYLVIPNDDYDLLKKDPVEKIRIYWSKGYEDYDIDYPEAFKKQIECIK